MFVNLVCRYFYDITLLCVVVLCINYLDITEASKEESAVSDLKPSKISTEDKQILGSEFRLPQHILPIHYDLLFNPGLELNVFNGEVNITVNVTKPTNYFKVNEKGLDVFKSEIYDISKNELISITRRFRHRLEYYIMETAEKVNVGQYVLRFEFRGVYEHGVGLYREEYQYAENEKRYLAMTFFAPVYARRAFPCFDEPSFKATFSVNVYHDSTHFAISNMPVKTEVELKNNRKLTQFEKTPLMSTYLLCIVVCDFEFKETVTDNGIKITAYASKSTIDKIETALNWTKEILTYFENYLNVTYPLKKLDIISLPEFDANGMENWGLITYKEQSLLIDNTSSVTHQLEVANLIAHELAHMWFGNLVTMKWWNETWLNEGFATHFAWKGAKRVLPEYFTLDDSGIAEACKIMQQDETIHARPVIRTVTEVMYSDVYNSIVYKKGASLLRMLEKFITEHDFIKGISNYLKKYAYGNVETEYLWREINEFTIKQGIDVSLLMNPWLTYKNFPYIDVKSSAQNDCPLVLFQNRFLLNPQSNDYALNQTNLQYIWNVPLTYTTSASNTVRNILFNSERESIACNQSELLKFNSQFTGYYSVKYSEKEWKQFFKILNENITVFKEMDRLNLLFDAFTLASGGKISYSVPLNLTSYLKKEEYHYAWSLYLEFMNTITKYLSDDKNSTRSIRKYTKQLSKKLYKKYGWDNKGHFLEKKLRRELIEAMCGNNARACLEIAADAYKKWMNGEMPNSEISELVFMYGLKTLNDEESYDHLWNRYLNETNPLLKGQYRDALAQVRKPSILKKLLKNSMDGRYFRLSWQVPMIKSIAENEKGFPIVSSYILNKWDDLARKLGIEQAENIAEAVFSKYQTEYDLNQVEEFYKKHPQSEERSEVRSRTLDSIKQNINWKLKFEAEVTEWFRINSNH